MSAAALLVALFNGAWQGVVLCAIAYVVLRSFRRLNAATLFAVWGALWAICVALPVANYLFAAKPITVDASARGAQQPAATQPRSSERVSQALLSRVPLRSASHARAVAATHYRAAGALGDHATAALGDRSAAALGNRAAAALRALLASAGIILRILAALAALRGAMLVRDILNMLVARRRVSRIVPPIVLRRSVRRPVTFASSAEFSSPCVLGFAPALVVIPEAILRGETERLRSVVLHECEHVRRFDDIQNVIVRFVDALLFFSPGVLIGARQLALYREQICDDAAIADTGDAISYASTLADMADWAPSRAPVPCLIFERKHLLYRVQVLLDAAASHSLRLDRRFTFVAVAALLLTAALALRVQLPVIAASVSRASLAGTARPEPSDSPHVHDNGGISVHVHDNDTRHNDTPRSAAQTVASAPRTFSGTFKLSGCATAGQVRLRLEYHYSRPGHSDSDDVAQCVPFSEFRGLTIVDLASGSVAHRTFTIVRDAGTMQAEGRIGDGAGSGTWTFVPSSSFVAELQRRGIDAPSAMQQFEWMMSDFRIETLDALRRHGFARPSVADLVTMGQVGVTNELVAAALRLPAQTKTVGALNRLAEVGVTADDIAGFERLGYRPSLEDLVRLKEVGVTPNYVAALERVGYHPSAQALMRLKEVGVEPSWVESKLSHAAAHPSIDELIRMKEQGF